MTKTLSMMLLCIAASLHGVLLTAQDRPVEPVTPRAIPKVIEGGMDNARLGNVIKRVDPAVSGEVGAWRFHVTGTTVMVVTDERADRMRIVIPIKKLEDVSGEELTRVMQANFDSALDARYAVARGTLWATYIHPLSALSEREFLLGLGQTVNIVRTYGRTYSSGLLIFGGGDSPELQERELIEELIRRGEFI